MRLIILSLLFYPIVSSADCGKSYGFSRLGFYTGMVKKQPNPMVKNSCFMPGRSTNKVPPSHVWKKAKFNRITRTWVLVALPIGQNPNPELYSRKVMPDGEEKWQIDLAKKKIRDDNRTALINRLNEIKALWITICAAPVGNVQKALCKERNL